LLPTALSIAGLDPSGGAGLAADLRGFDAAGVWGAAVCAALTVQSTRGVLAVQAVATDFMLRQARAVLEDARVRVMKTGALGSPGNVRAVVRLLAERPDVPSVVDPVMAPSRGRGSLAGRAPTALRALAAVATVLTPNHPEAGALLGEEVSDETAPLAARALVERGAQAVLVKGGHGKGPAAVDWLALRGGDLVRIARPWHPGPPVHGTGCTLASLIAGRLAARASRTALQPTEIVEAVRWARARLDRALASRLEVGRGQRVIRVAPPRALGRRRGGS